MEIKVYASKDSLQILGEIEINDDEIVSLIENNALARCYRDDEGNILVEDIWGDTYETGVTISPNGFVLA